MKFRRWVGSVRTRVTAAATLTVVLALVVVGVFIVRSTASASVEDAQRAAELQARNLAVAVEAGRITPVLDVDSAGTTILQVVGEGGQVEAASPQLRNMPALEPAPPSVGEQKPATVRVVSLGGGQTDYRVVTLSVDSAKGPLAVTAGVSLQPAQKTIDRLVKVLIFGFGVMSIAAAGVAWLLVGWALRPVDAIRKEVDGLTEVDLDRRVPVPDHQDEVRDLAVTMNRMLQRLEEATDRQRAFIGDASHELRSPIASLRAQLEVAATHPETVGTAELAKETLADVVRLQHLSDNLLLLARLDAEASERQQRQPLLQVLRQALADRHGDRVPVLTEVGGEDCGMAAPGSFTQVVTNLVDNAVRHAETRVVVRVLCEPERTLLIVEDDGPGIRHADRERVFERFVRLDDARSRESGGAGLGLAIARDLARSLGGDVSAEEGQSGAQLKFYLPN